MKEMKDSLEANKAEILNSLPAEFHADFDKELNNMSDAPNAPISGEAEIAAIKAELVANPAVDENAAADELKEIKSPGRIEPDADA